MSHTTPAIGRLEPLLTPAEVAGILRLKPRTVVRMAREGQLAAVRVDGRGTVRFTQAAVQKYLDDNAIEPAA